MGYLFWFWYAVGFGLLVFYRVPDFLGFSNGLFLLFFAMYAISMEIRESRLGGAGSALYLYVRASVVFISTMLIEAYGVATAIPFGRYDYTPVLGITAWGVPLAIGAAWVGVVSVCSAMSASASRLWSAVQTGLWAMCFDIVLDPASEASGFWKWSDSGYYYGIPWQNFASWFVIAFVLAWLLYPPRRSDKACGPSISAAPFRLYQALVVLFGILAWKAGLSAAGFAAVLITAAAEGRLYDARRKAVKGGGRRDANPRGQTKVV
ncbi:carotenoid biosynthesis protein [Paenibacillus sp. GCM10012303]|jgi:putative membrane protein|uniref:carotenoid biosynthesis protein n=1 Tax=Paenibacillus sp. GCM10012303 TaxID=3317340 RepID=UPI00361FA92B